MKLVGAGYVSPQELDHVIKNGLGLHWSFLGPFETIELNAPGGIPDYVARYSAFYQRLAADPATPSAWAGKSAARVADTWERQPDARDIVARAKARDERLAALKRTSVRFRHNSEDCDNPQGDDHVRRHRRSPYAVHVTAFARHTERHRRRGDRCGVRGAASRCR
jgi:3-hydroxyacyl-CoA dehydrogenase